MAIRAYVIVFVALATWETSAMSTSVANDSPVQPLETRALDEAGSYGFLASALHGVEVVSLAESIHMTHEFPLVRLGMVRALNERHGFHVVAAEGSAVDSWVAQDRLLNSPRGPADTTAALDAHFPLWHTPEVARLFAYEAASLDSSQPLYLTAYDVQPGSGAGWDGAALFVALAERLSSYGPPPPELEVQRWAQALVPLTSCLDGYRSIDEASVVAAIAALEGWIGRIAPAVERRFARVPHAAVLRLLPHNLRATLSVCETMARSNDASAYMRVRDENAAAYTQALKDQLPGGKLILWAHVSHLDHDPKRASVGSALRAALGARLYTVGMFAQAGGALMIFPTDNNNDIGYGRVRDTSEVLATQVSTSPEHDFFVDLRKIIATGGPLTSAVTAAQPVWIESKAAPVVLSSSYDGLVWLRAIHAPDLPWLKLLLFGSLHYARWLVLAAVALAASVLATIAWRILARRRVRATDTQIYVRK